LRRVHFDDSSRNGGNVIHMSILIGAGSQPKIISFLIDHFFRHFGGFLYFRVKPLPLSLFEYSLYAHSCDTTTIVPNAYPRVVNCDTTALVTDYTFLYSSGVPPLSDVSESSAHGKKAVDDNGYHSVRKLSKFDKG